MSKINYCLIKSLITVVVVGSIVNDVTQKFTLNLLVAGSQNFGSFREQVDKSSKQIHDVTLTYPHLLLNLNFML